jgi:hypothetical protein
MKARPGRASLITTTTLCDPFTVWLYARLFRNKEQRIMGNKQIIRVGTILLIIAGTVLPPISVVVAKAPPQVPSAPLLISEFRLRGPSALNAANDEFVEIYNNSDSDVMVNAKDGSAGFALAASDGFVRFTIPNGAVIPARGHYLGVNSTGYSLGAYAAGDAAYTTDIADNAGIALFNTSTPANFTLATRLDAAGSTSEANALYREGAGYPALTAPSIDYSFVRKISDTCDGVSCSAILPGCTPSNVTSGAVTVEDDTPQDTDDNGNDFIFVDTNATAGQPTRRLGAPGPENLTSPIHLNSLTGMSRALLDSTKSPSESPNLFRDLTSDPANNSTFGVISLRRRFVNNTGANLTRLRFRIVDLSTAPAPSGIADLRLRTSLGVQVASINDPATCAATGTPAAAPCTVFVQGTTLEQPPPQVLGGGYNSSLSAGTVTPGTPIATGASINLQFLFGVEQNGCYRIGIIVEALPSGGGQLWYVWGDTNTPTTVEELACTITCPSNITQSNEAGQCGAAVNYAAPATANCGTAMCSPASGSFFPVGATTVTCATDAGPSCSFTVTVNDTQAPTINCPPNVIQPFSPGQSSAIVNYPAPTTSDNCPNVVATCSPASGSVFPVGTTTVTCTATDATGNTAQCSFLVTTFDICLQDDSSAGRVLMFNSTSGAYLFCCGATMLTGNGKVVKQGNDITLQHNALDRRVTVKVSLLARKGTASLQYPPGTTACTIKDSNTTNNTCACDH